MCAQCDEDITYNVVIICALYAYRDLMQNNYQKDFLHKAMADRSVAR